MTLALYSAVVSLVYLAVYVLSPETADALVILFVGLLLLPAMGKDASAFLRRRRHG